MDLRTPIGYLFTLVGLILAGWGLLGDKTLTHTKAGDNINLCWGLVVLVFGLAMWFSARCAAKCASKTDGDSCKTDCGRK